MNEGGEASFFFYMWHFNFKQVDHEPIHGVESLFNYLSLCGLSTRGWDNTEIEWDVRCIPATLTSAELLVLSEV